MYETEAGKLVGLPKAPPVTDQSWTSRRSILLGFVVGGAFLLLAFREAPFQGFVDALKTADPQSILIGIGLYALYLVARASRWSLLLAERTETRPFSVLFRALTWGTAANSIIPHSGEILRSFATRRQLGISATSILSSIACERLYDFAAIIALTGLTLLLFQECPPVTHSALCAICAIGLVLLAGLVLLGFRYPLVIRVIDLLVRLLPCKFRRASKRHVHEISMGIRAALSSRHMVKIGLLSICQWLCVTGCIYMSMQALGLSLSPWVAVIVLAITIAGLTLPTAPAYLGTMQVCFLVGLTPFGVSNETAIAASVAYTSIITVPIIVVSVIWYLLCVFSRKQAI